ncbi:MAG: hypothetical protein JXA54_15585 [Candidatus Heimdallarchaeota archaeon]|nr:hypothetical protein [Candidatus Heimdallarchaeota archaeon]
MTLKLNAAPIWEKIALGALAVISGAILITELLGDTLTAGLVTATRIALTVVLILLFIYDFVYDLIDENTIPG